jgi:hypothetical protein
MKLITYIYKNIEKGISYSEENLLIAQQEAENGEYSIIEIEDEMAAVPTQLDKIEAQITYTAMMTNTLLEV